MRAEPQELAAPGPARTRRRNGETDSIGRPSLRPALLASYTELSRLRYDYPLVLVEGDADGGPVRSLSGVIDGVLQAVAPQGMDGERLRKHVLRLEHEMRALAARGTEGPLSQLWDRAAGNLLSQADGEARTALTESLSRARRVLQVDGSVVDCDERTPAKLLKHLWTSVQKDKARQVLNKVDRLILRLSDILKADFVKSDDARSAANLRRSVGTAYEAAFDFEAMSGILGKASSNDMLPDGRRQRVRAAVSVLESQRFFAPATAGAKDGRDGPHSFVFESCARATEAFQERLPEMVALIKAISIAELEIENQYRESKHDSFFRRFDESSLVPEDLAYFPSYLVCLRDGHRRTGEKAKLMDILSSGLPVKVLVSSGDILEELSSGAGQVPLGVRNSRLASVALGLSGTYVLQSSGSHLYQLAERILKGLEYSGPALFSIFAGSSGNAPDLPPYLATAAAMESRAFPAFTYDPGAGQDWASRFCIGENPQPSAAWPSHRISYEDEDLQRISEDVAFTFADFVACDRRYAGCFTEAPRSTWHDGMVPVREFLDLEPEGVAGKVPYILMVDDGDILQRAIVDDKLIRAARRCADAWHSLQELGGIDNSHARRLLDKEREIWEQEKQQERKELGGQRAHDAPGPVAKLDAGITEKAPPGAAEAAPEAPADEPYIETPRCTTCNECTAINGNMFAYNENMQAYIADPDAGTYRQLVEAAESCQVCIIHPGKPRNPNEENLEELIARAEPFL